MRERSYHGATSRSCFAVGVAGGRRWGGAVGRGDEETLAGHQAVPRPDPRREGRQAL